MLSLRLLGGPCIVGPDEQLVSGRAVQRHRLALLALLALAPEQGLSRDKLLALLWPERDVAHGRNLLKQAVYIVRASLGGVVVPTFADALRLDHDRMRVDVTAFEAAVEREDHAGALALYRGPFLDGFFITDAPEFERWIEEERQRIAGLYWSMLEASAEAAESAGDVVGAVVGWRRRVAQDPYDSRVALEASADGRLVLSRRGALVPTGLYEGL